MAIRSVATARSTPSEMDRPAANTTIPSELSRNTTGTRLVGRTVEALLAADTPMPCHAAKAIRKVPTRYRLSSGVPVTYVFVVTCSTKTLSAAANRTSPAPSVHHRRPGRQPRTANTATTMVTRTMSPIGYAMFVASVPKSPAVLALMIGPITRVDPSAAINPSTQMVFEVCGTVSRTRRPMPGNAKTKNVRKQASEIEGYGRGTKYCTHVVHRTDPAVKNHSPTARAPQPQRPRRRASARQEHSVAQPTYPRLAIKTSKKKSDVPCLRRTVDPRYSRVRAPVTNPRTITPRGQRRPLAGIGAAGRRKAESSGFTSLPCEH